MKFNKSTYYIIKNCLNLVKWEADCYDKNSKQYKWLLDIIVFLDLKLGELIDEYAISNDLQNKVHGVV